MRLSGWMFKLLFVFLGFVAITIGIYFVSLQFGTRQKDTTAVVKEIRTLSRWETASYTIEKIIDSGNSGNAFERLLFGNRILLIAHGEVVAGLDLSTVTEQDITINGTAISLRLPSPQILSTRLDNEKTRVYDRQKGLLVPQDNNLESDARLSAEQSIRAAACDSGVLVTASDNAKKQLTSLLSSLGFVTIDITIPMGVCN